MRCESRFVRKRASANRARSDSTTIKYYSFAGQTIAMNDGSGLQYFLTDHLGSVVAVTNASGTLISQQRYLPFGGERTNLGSSISQTDYGYTGQRDLDPGMGGLMDYKARFYSPYLNHFIQPDTLIPDPSNPQAWNRFGYVHNSPINFNDPTGHARCDEDGNCMMGNRPTLGIHAEEYAHHGYWEAEDEGELVSEEIGQFYVGPNIPKALSEYEASAYNQFGMANTISGPWASYGDGVGFLWDMTGMYSQLRNNSNVGVFANLKRYGDGTVDIASLTIINASDERIFINYVTLTSKGNLLLESITGSCNSLDQCYNPSPPRVVPRGNDDSYFATIDPKSIEIVSLTPSGNPINPNNHFGPQGIQSVELSIYFRFTSELSFLTINETIIP